MNRAGLPVAGFALLLAAGALVLIFVALQIHVREVDMLWGPRLFPVAVMAALAIIGGTVAVSELFFRESGVDPRKEPNDWSAMADVLLGLALFSMLVEPVGFVMAAATLFAAVSRGFGSRRLILDAAVGLVLAAAIYALFVRGLGLYLPGGTLFSALLGR
jgi:putative tricarboxylic transport membrane protein